MISSLVSPDFVSELLGQDTSLPEHLAQRRKGGKEIKLPAFACLASWREQIPFFGQLI
jgi:hypothetical protein